MSQSTEIGAEAPQYPHRTEQENSCNFLGQDIQKRFGSLLMGYNAAVHDLLESTGPNSIRRTEEDGIYEIKTQCGMSTSTMTATVISEDNIDRLEPLDFRTDLQLPFLPVFSYDQECADAYVIRLMTAWLEKTFLIHEKAILEGIRSLP